MINFRVDFMSDLQSFPVTARYFLKVGSDVHTFLGGIHDIDEYTDEEYACMCDSLIALSNSQQCEDAYIVLSILP